MAIKKKGNTRVRRASAPKRIKVTSKNWAIGSVVVLALAIPITMSLISQSQDIRQQAAETRINSTVVTTVPTDILNIDISDEDGTTEEIDDSGSGNNNGSKDKKKDNDGSDNGGGQGTLEECEVEDVSEKSVGGMMRTININCDGQDQTVDQSGSDGNNQVIKSGGKDGNIDKTPRDRTKNPKKNTKGKKDNRNWIQQFIDRILGRQGR